MNLWWERAGRAAVCLLALALLAAVQRVFERNAPEPVIVEVYSMIVWFIVAAPLTWAIWRGGR